MDSLLDGDCVSCLYFFFITLISKEMLLQERASHFLGKQFNTKNQWQVLNVGTLNLIGFDFQNSRNYFETTCVCVWCHKGDQQSTRNKIPVKKTHGSLPWINWLSTPLFARVNMKSTLFLCQSRDKGPPVGSSALSISAEKAPHFHFDLERPFLILQSIVSGITA